MKRLSDLPNIGAEIENKLLEAGINTPEELVSLGSKNAFIKIKLLDPTACVNMLMSLEGAVQEVRWHSLSVETKDDLKLFFGTL